MEKFVEIMDLLNIKQVASTKSVDYKYRYVWKVSIEHTTKKCNFYSPLFTVELKSQNWNGYADFRISMVRDDCNKDYLISLEFDKRDPILTLGVYKIKARIVISNSDEKKIFEETKNEFNSSYLNKYPIIDKVASTLEDKFWTNDFTVTCDIFCFKNETNFENPSTLLTSEMNDASTLLDRLQKLFTRHKEIFESGMYSDFKIIAPCKKTFNVHKLILSAQSPVFAALFETDMREKAKNEIEIKDISYKALQEMLRFMYIGKIENIEDLIGEIMEAAERYQVAGLKNKCAEFYYSNMTDDNVVEILVHSYRLNLELLKIKAIKYIKTNAEKVINTKGFQSLDEKDNVTEIIRALVIQ